MVYYNQDKVTGTLLENRFPKVETIGTGVPACSTLLTAERAGACKGGETNGKYGQFTAEDGFVGRS